MLAWLLLTACALFNVLGGIASKAWYSRGGAPLLALAIGCFLADLGAWMAALHYRVPLAKGSVFFTGAVTLLGIAAGIYYDADPVSPPLVVGAALVLVGVIVAAAA